MYPTLNEQHRNEESGSGNLGLGQVQDPYGYTGFPGVNPAAAAAAVAALSQLTQFAGALDDHGRFRHTVCRFVYYLLSHVETCWF